MEIQGIRPAKTTLRQNKAERFILPHFEIYYKAAIFKTAWYWSRDRHVCQWNRTASPQTVTPVYAEFMVNQ